jgi:hypothetical protein
MTDKLNEKFEGRRFGRIQSPIDERDWCLDKFVPDEPVLVLPKHKKWDFPLPVLDQEQTPYCVGFSMAHFGICEPTFTPYTKKDATEMYYECKEKDGDPRGQSGTTIRSAAKVLRDRGAIENYAFASSIDQIKWWLLNRGPIIVGTIWTEEMMNPDADGNLNIDGFIVGGHAYLLDELTDDDRIGFSNSWGTGWGKNGKAYMSLEDFEKLFERGGEALAAVELEEYKTSMDSWIVRLINKIIEWILN